MALGVRAAEVLNKAALIASDCGVPDLARDLCWSQHDVCERFRPLPGWAVALALQPLLNLPRQLIREGDGDVAHAVLGALYHAASTGTTASILGRDVCLSRVTRAADDRAAVLTLVWAAMLADGTRALTLAGRWPEAAAFAAEHRGIGTRLLDGRQITILARLHGGQAAQAAGLVEHSHVPEPWERCVQELLRVICLRVAGTLTPEAVTTAATSVMTLLNRPDPPTAVFRIRAAITAIELTAHDDPAKRLLHQAVAAQAAGDAYAARDVLAHLAVRELATSGQLRRLDQLVDAAGLGHGEIPAPLRDRLAHATATALATLESVFRARKPAAITRDVRAPVRIGLTS